jgi:RNA polymerase sigma-70 factor (ECF subfamily)
MTLESEQLLLLAGRGNREAMGELYRRHKPQIMSFFRHMRVAREHVEDLTQEVFLRIWKSAARYRPSGKYSSFMFTVAANVWRDHCRRSRVRRAVPEADPVTDGRTRPDGVSVRAEFRRDLDEALGNLPENERMTFVLSEIQGVSYRDIARITRCRIGTVGSRKARAVRHLRRLLIEHAPEKYPKEAVKHEVSG